MMKGLEVTRSSLIVILQLIEPSKPSCTYIVTRKSSWDNVHCEYFRRSALHCPSLHLKGLKLLRILWQHRSHKKTNSMHGANWRSTTCSPPPCNYQPSLSCFTS
jgi:hypothetical protein